MTFPALPCHPCPFNSSCCNHGTTLSKEEADAIARHHGPGLVYETRWGEWRTRVKNRKCALFQNGGCSVHAKPYYPTLCAAFPWTDGDTGGRYEYDLSICGMFTAHPELVDIQRAIPPAPE